MKVLHLLHLLLLLYQDFLSAVSQKAVINFFRYLDKFKCRDIVGPYRCHGFSFRYLKEEVGKITVF